ncbi:MAG: DMT family transporter [Pseudomonadota bacterium]
MSPVLLGSLAALFWGVHDLVAGISSRKLGHMVVVLGVTVFGLLAITGWIGFTSEFPNVIRGDVWVPLVAGVGYACATLFLFAAFAAGPFSIAAPVGGSYPLTSMVIAALLGNPTSGLQLLAALAVVAGVVIVAVTEPDEGGAQTYDKEALRRTLICAGLAHISFAFAIALGQQAAVLFGAVEGTWISRIAGALLILCLFFTINARRTLPVKWVAPVVVIGCLDAAAISLLNAAGNTDQPQIAAVAGSAFGVVTILLARIILKEHIPPKRWLGIALTFAGVAILSALE